MRRRVFLLTVSLCTFTVALFFSVRLTPPEDVQAIRQLWAEPAVQTYSYEVCNCAGLTQIVKLDGEDVFIKFRADSDRLAVAALAALKHDVAEPNLDGHHIFITGQLYAEPQYELPLCQGCRERQKYYYFRLMNWYLITPFEEYRWVADATVPSGYSPVMTPRDSLQLEDFADFEGKDRIELRMFQRAGK